MHEFCAHFYENGDPVQKYDLVLAEHQMDDGLTPGEVAAMAGRMAGPFEPIQFEGNNSIAMGFITLAALEAVSNKWPVSDDSAPTFYGDALESYISSILDDMDTERPSGRYKFELLDEKTTIHILLRRDIKTPATSIQSVLELSTMHIKPETFQLLLHSDDFMVFPKKMDGDVYGCFLAVPQDTDLPYRTPTDLVDCIQAAYAADADWIMFDADGCRDSNLPCYTENWVDWN